MTHLDQYRPRSLALSATTVTDEGPRVFRLGVYAQVGSGLIASGALAWVTSHPPFASYHFHFAADGRLPVYSVAGMILIFAPLAILLGASFIAAKVTLRSAGLLYWGLIGLLGASLGAIIFVYTATSIATTFFAAAAAFGALSLYGYATKRDRTGVGSGPMIGSVGPICPGSSTCSPQERYDDGE